MRVAVVGATGFQGAPWRVCSPSGTTGCEP